MTTLIISIADEATADAFMSYLFGGDQTGSFPVRLSATGCEPATHLGAFHYIADDEPLPPCIYAYDYEFDDVLAYLGLHRIAEID